MHRKFANVYHCQHPVLLTEAPLNPRRHRERAAEILFERFNIPALFTSIQAVLSLYASGRTTGLVLDSGDGVTYAVPVYDGFSIPTSFQRSDIAGRDVTEYMQLLLRKAGYTLNTSAEKEIVRTIKEKHAYIATNVREEERRAYEAEAAAAATTTASTSLSDTTNGKLNSDEYELPDGRNIRMGMERFKAPEILFNPGIIGSEDAGVTQLISDSLHKTDTDLRRSLYANILLSGGSTLTKGKFILAE